MPSKILKIVLGPTERGPGKPNIEFPKAVALPGYYRPSYINTYLRHIDKLVLLLKHG